jgi:hypothetical protein
MTSSKALYDYLMEEGKAVHPAIIFDLFGYVNWTDGMKETLNDTINMFLGLYNGLIFMDVSHEELHNCFLQNNLDTFMHTKYSCNQSDYYREFCANKIKIGNTFIM